MIHCSCSGIEYFLCSVGLLAEYFVVILLARRHCRKSVRACSHQFYDLLFFLTFLCQTCVDGRSLSLSFLVALLLVPFGGVKNDTMCIQ